MTAPPAVVRLVDSWVAEGSPPQEPIRWSPERWLAGSDRYPRAEGYSGIVEEVVAALPARLARADVAKFGASAADGAEEALMAFVATMVWGFGRTGYGVFRTDRILAVNKDAAAKLRHVAQVVRNDGPVEGFRMMANDDRLKWLGPAFGTKYLHFCSTPDKPALILDDLVATWLDEHCDTSLRPLRWSTKLYDRYHTSMTGWADGRCAVTDLETRVFVAEATRREGNQWASTNSAGPR